AYWTKGPWSANLRETIYGKTSALVSTNGATWYNETIGVTGITDLEGSYAVNKTLKLSLGANNLFDQKPPNRPQNPATHTIYDGSN
ncbi:TonB-dependent receptor, partial [Pseudomonas sp. FW305-42]|uniref:TonB-dependent receptor n=1 Tax=Pseudomonas sp. FW305-42 TaxID=2070677 RepID=UPI000CBE93C4